MLMTMGVPFLPQGTESLSNLTQSGNADADAMTDGTASHRTDPTFGSAPESVGISSTNIDEMGQDLGNWFQGNHEMLRLLDDSYLRQ